LKLAAALRLAPVAWLGAAAAAPTLGAFSRVRLGDPALQERAAHGQEEQVAVVPDAPVAGVMPGKITPGVEANRAGGQEFVGEARQQGFGDHASPRQQNVQMIALRDALSWFWAAHQLITFDERDALEVVREDAGGEKAGHAAAENDGMTQRAASRPCARMGKGAHELCSMR